MSGALTALIEPGSVHELRVPKAGRARVISGYFDDSTHLVAAADKLSGHYPGIYFTVNPTKPALLARAHNRVLEHAELTSSDHDIECRRWLPIDLDPVRPTGICATVTEHDAAIQRGREIWTHLREQGWPDPVVMDSGNGCYLLVRIDTPNDEAGRKLLERCLKALAFRFNDDLVHVDQTMFNAARIIRVPDTLNAKGDDTPERPHRLARWLHMPDSVAVVTIEKLAALAATLPGEPEPESRNRNRVYPTGAFDLDAFVRDHLNVHRRGDWNGGYRWVLSECPFNSDHTDNAAYVGRGSRDGIFAGCQHDSCIWGWAELREKFEPGYADRRQRSQSSAGQPKDEAGTPLSFKTARQRSAEKPPKVDWVVNGLAAKGVGSELDGPQKLSGKTTLLAYAVQAKLDGLPFLGQSTQAGPVIWCTEESWASFQEPLGEVGLLDRDDLHILCREDAFGVPWAEVARQARLKAMEVGANLVIGDTLSSLAGLKGDEENSSGSAGEAMRPVQELAASGVAVIVTRHDRRAGGEVGESGRGSTAFTGAVDVVLRLTRVGGDGRASTRKLEYVGRIRGVPADRFIALTDHGYELVGSEADVKRREAEALLLEHLPDTEEYAVTLPSLWAPADAAKGREAGPLAGYGIGKTTFKEGADFLLAAGNLAKRVITRNRHVWWCIAGAPGSTGYGQNRAESAEEAESMAGGPSPIGTDHGGHAASDARAPAFDDEAEAHEEVRL